MTRPRLVSLTLLGKPNGLEMPSHNFGHFLTLVHGDNGSGKTAVMCSLFWALGGARRVEEPLWSQCIGVRLSIIGAQGGTATITREFRETLRATIDEGNVRSEFQDDAAFSLAILKLLGIPNRTWTTRSGDSVGVYMSVLLPAIAIDQDKGWTLPYAPFAATNFVEDQAEEVSRLLLGLDARHNAERDRMRETLIRERDRLERESDVRDRVIQSLSLDAARSESRDLSGLRIARERLIADLRTFDGVVTAFAEADAGMGGRVEEARTQRDKTARDLAASRQHREALDRLMHGVTADLDVVGSNEVAAQAFRRFCSNPGCGFFQGRDVAASYGRRVLYLKDQLKDLATAMDSAQSRVATLELQLAGCEAQLTRVRSEYEHLANTSPATQIIAAVDALTKDLARVSAGIAGAEQLEAARAERQDTVQAHSRLIEDLHNHDQVRVQRGGRVGEVRMRMQSLLLRWLAVLSTNPLGVVALDECLRVTIGGKILNDQRGPSGSSRLRLVLAFHAARLEAALEGDGYHPGFLLFDAPKQHEIDPAHFIAYVGALRELSARFPGQVQVVVSSRTEIPRMADESIWQPRYPATKGGGGHPWFLGPARFRTDGQTEQD